MQRGCLFDGGSEALASDPGNVRREFLSANAARVFGLIAASLPVPPEDADSVAELVADGWVVLDGEHENRPVALDPTLVARRRMQQDLEAAMCTLEALRGLPDATEALYGQYARTQLRAGGSAEYIDDPAVVNARLDDVVGGARREILSAQPSGPRSEAQLARSLERDSAALDRGVVKRTIYRATVREHPVTAEYARAMSQRAAGRSAEYRTLVGPFERVIIVDRQVVFISDYLVADGPEHAAWQVTDQAVIAYMVAEFEGKWRRADPWQGELRGRGLVVDTFTGPDGVRTSRRQREIMRDLVDGVSQKVIATRLGISARTVSTEIEALKDLFDAQSREQLCFKWAWVPDRLVDDSVPDAVVATPGRTAA